MLPNYMKTLYEHAMNQVKEKTQQEIRRRMHALGINQEKVYNYEREIFFVCQHIAHFIDLHDWQNTNIHSVEFAIAVFIYHCICDYRYNVWESVKFIEEMAKRYKHEKEQVTLEIFKPNENIKLVEFERQFSCICTNNESVERVLCEKCLKQYHPSCQYQPLVCNKCYLTHFFFPLDTTFYSRFGEKFVSKTYFHGNFKTFNSIDEKKIQLFCIKFDINDFADLQTANQPQIMIKMINFKHLQSNTVKHKKWQNMTKNTSQFSVILNTNKFEFYLNFVPLRRKNLYFRNENSIIFKLENRIINPEGNILMVKCEPDFWQEEHYEIGIFRVSKMLEKRNSGNNEVESQMAMRLAENQQKTFRLTNDQFDLLQRYSSNNKINPKNDNSHSADRFTNPRAHPTANFTKSQRFHLAKQNESDSQHHPQHPHPTIKPHIELVRSYSCTHPHGINYYQLKRSYQLQKANKKPLKNRQQQKHEIQKLIESQLYRLYKDHSTRFGVKSQEELMSEEEHKESIRKYCLDNGLLRFVDIPELKKYDENLVGEMVKKHIGRYMPVVASGRFHKVKHHERNQKEAKKYEKFITCPHCQNHLTTLYLLPQEHREGTAFPLASRLPNRRRLNQSVPQVRNIFRRPMRSIFKKEEEDDSDFEEVEVEVEEVEVEEIEDEDEELDEVDRTIEIPDEEEEGEEREYKEDERDEEGHYERQLSLEEEKETLMMMVTRNFQNHNNNSNSNNIPSNQLNQIQADQQQQHYQQPSPHQKNTNDNKQDDFQVMSQQSSYSVSARQPDQRANNNRSPNEQNVFVKDIKDITDVKSFDHNYNYHYSYNNNNNNAEASQGELEAVGNVGYVISGNDDNRKKSSDNDNSNSPPVQISLLSDDEEEGEMRLYEEIAF